MCAFGDGGNDLEMLREVGDGVAMKNAVPALLEVANHVTDTNDEEGVSSKRTFFRICLTISDFASLI